MQRLVNAFKTHAAAMDAQQTDGTIWNHRVYKPRKLHGSRNAAAGRCSDKLAARADASVGTWLGCDIAAICRPAGFGVG